MDSSTGFSREPAKLPGGVPSAESSDPPAMRPHPNQYVWEVVWSGWNTWLLCAYGMLIVGGGLCLFFFLLRTCYLVTKNCPPMELEAFPLMGLIVCTLLFPFGWMLMLVGHGLLVVAPAAPKHRLRWPAIASLICQWVAWVHSNLFFVAADLFLKAAPLIRMINLSCIGLTVLLSYLLLYLFLRRLALQVNEDGLYLRLALWKIAVLVPVWAVGFGVCWMLDNLKIVDGHEFWPSTLRFVTPQLQSAVILCSLLLPFLLMVPIGSVCDTLRRLRLAPR